MNFLGWVCGNYCSLLRALRLLCLSSWQSQVSPQAVPSPRCWGWSPWLGLRDAQLRDLGWPSGSGDTCPGGNAAGSTRGTEFTAQGWEQAPQAALCPLWESPEPPQAGRLEQPPSCRSPRSSGSGLWERGATGTTPASSELGDNELGVTITALSRAAESTATLPVAPTVSDCSCWTKTVGFHHARLPEGAEGLMMSLGGKAEP